MSPSIVDECTLRWTTISPPRWASAIIATWLAWEAPFTRNQVRCAPHASAARRCASWNGVGTSPMSTPWVSDGMSKASAFSPTASTSPGSAPIPPLCPGT